MRLIRLSSIYEQCVDNCSASFPAQNLYTAIMTTKEISMSNSAILLIGRILLAIRFSGAFRPCRSGTVHQLPEKPGHGRWFSCSGCFGSGKPVGGRSPQGLSLTGNKIYNASNRQPRVKLISSAAVCFSGNGPVPTTLPCQRHQTARPIYRLNRVARISMPFSL